MSIVSTKNCASKSDGVESNGAPEMLYRDAPFTNEENVSIDHSLFSGRMEKRRWRMEGGKERERGGH